MFSRKASSLNLSIFLPIILKLIQFSSKMYYGCTGCSKLVFTLLKKLFATKSTQKIISKIAIDGIKYTIFIGHDCVTRRTSNILCQMFYKNRKLHGGATCILYHKIKFKRHDFVPSYVTISKRVKTFRERSAAT